MTGYINSKNDDRDKSIILRKFIKPQNKYGEYTPCYTLFPLEIQKNFIKYLEKYGNLRN